MTLFCCSVYIQRNVRTQCSLIMYTHSCYKQSEYGTFTDQTDGTAVVVHMYLRHDQGGGTGFMPMFLLFYCVTQVMTAR